ncbi:MAG TPA: MlaE family lipid ABC transporter permease subunit [Dissulfurispiraceae bacterium]|nr:MlaE family lipid ABC transporter permease subunit [Dissulfurispiraceae bacterium]
MGTANLIRAVGAATLQTIQDIGRMSLFFIDTVRIIFVPPFKFLRFIKQVRFIGARSMSVIILTGAFTGMVLALQLFYTLRKFGSEALLGPAIALSLIRELGPVLAALMVTGRAGSAITAEIGIMRISEQIDALTSMALNPLRYLVVPNLTAAILAFPLLAAIFDVVGIYGGYAVAVKMLGLSSGTYFSQMEHFVLMDDVMIGVYKSISFGAIVAWVCCYKGYTTEDRGFGAEGVGRSTTEAVVMSSVFILICDYIIGTFFL